jgi:hypothetical protein
MCDTAKNHPELDDRARILKGGMGRDENDGDIPVVQSGPI